MYEATVPNTDKWSDSMKMIMLENDLVPLPHIKSVKDMAEKLKTHSGDIFFYDYYKQLLKLSAQNHDQSNRANLYRVARETCERDLNSISDLTEMSNSLQETCDINSPNPVLMANIMNRRGSNNKFNGNGNKHAFFDKDNVILKEYYVALTPETKEFWNSIPNKEKASILRSSRNKPKPKPQLPMLSLPSL